MNSTVRLCVSAVLALTLAIVASGCQWRGLNSLTLPGTAGDSPGSFVIKAEMPDVTNLDRNSRVRVADAVVGTVTDVQVDGWHAMVTMRLDGDVDLPANATVKVGQTSLLGSLHVELAPPTGTAPKGQLHEGSLIPLASAGSYPTTEQTLSSLSVLLNGGGLGQIKEVNDALTTAFANGRDADLRKLLEQLNDFTTRLNGQTDTIIAAADSINNVAGQFAAQKPVLDQALKSIPEAARTLADRREQLLETLDSTGRLADLTQQTLGPTKDSLLQELRDLGPVLESLANAGPALTRSLSLLGTFPIVQERIPKNYRGDYSNLTIVLDLTLSRVDAGLLTGTRFEGVLTEWEMQWGRTIGQIPSPFTSANPLVVPYHVAQGS
jgi:phospholipid/cholesterol/gamma-HCH transport system substrate-binding protein